MGEEGRGEDHALTTKLAARKRNTKNLIILMAAKEEGEAATP